MAKEKKSKAAVIPQKNIHLRLAFLHQAASHLAQNRQNDIQASSGAGNVDTPKPDARSVRANAQPRYLVNQMKGVSRKSVIRLHKDVKRSTCKKCDVLLVEGETAITTTENKSTKQSKPWADVLVTECRMCGTSKRFPVGVDKLTQKSNHKDDSEAALMSRE